MFVGVVEDNYDPIEEGRLKIRIFGVNDQKDADDKYVIPTQYLPWARSGCINCSGSFSVPKIGSHVYVQGDLIYNPIWTGLVYLNDGPKGEIGEDRNAHVLLYDTDFSNGEETNYREGQHVKMYYTDEKGVVIDYKSAAGGSTFNMNPDGSVSITDSNGDTISMSNGKIVIKSDNSITISAPLVQLGEDAVESIIRSEAFRKIFETHTHLYESGETLPPKSGMNPNCINKKIKI